MVRFLKTLLLALVVVGGVWLLLNKDRIEQPQDVLVLAQEELSELRGRANQNFADGQTAFPARQPPSRNQRAQSPFQPAAWPSGNATRQPRRTIRVATWKIDAVESASTQRSQIVLADTCRRYDIIALQGVGSIAARSLAAQVNALERGAASGQQSGGHLLAPDYQVLTDRRSEAREATGLVFLYDANAVEADGKHCYRVGDPDSVLAHRPLVAWFRARGVASDRAFTFSLANVHLDQRRPDRELRHLSELFRAIRDDGRGEDDIIMAGNFNSGDRGLAPYRKKSGLTWVVSGTATNTLQTAQVDNIVFQQAATVEFAQRSGVFDFLKHHNLRISDAASVSSHLPVWAEFNLEEGNASPVVASGPRRSSF